MKTGAAIITGRATARCRQCWKVLPLTEFRRDYGGLYVNCAGCRDRMAAHRGKVGARLVEARRRLPLVSHGPPRVTWTASSMNRKLGPIPAATVSGETCPPSCGFYGKGCFAEFGILGSHWRNVGWDGLSWTEFVQAVADLPEGQLWRYATAGDLPGQGEDLDIELLAELVEANEGKRGFAFTHKSLERPNERKAVARANRAGFTINLSADSLAQADERAALGVGPVVVVLPLGATGDIRTPAGRRVVVCPAESRGLTCEDCGLCARAERKGIVGFVAHGQMKRAVSRIAEGLR